MNVFPHRQILASFTNLTGQMNTEAHETRKHAQCSRSPTLVVVVDTEAMSPAAGSFRNSSSLFYYGCMTVRVLQAIEEETVKKWIKATGKTLDCKGKRLFMPIRIALTGQMAGPDVAVLVQTLHKAADGEILVEGYVPLEQRIATLKEWVAAN